MGADNKIDMNSLKQFIQKEKYASSQYVQKQQDKKERDKTLEADGRFVSSMQALKKGPK